MIEEQAVVESDHVWSVAIIGAGFAGLGMAIQLKKAGIHDFIVLEKAGEVGGTWRENTYPGCACDIMSMLYSFSFEPKHDWSRLFPEQREILDYLKYCADTYDVRRHIRFNTTVVGAEYDDGTDRWHLDTAHGENVRAHAVVGGFGPLHVPHVPEIGGLERFKGKAFHSAEWDHDYDLTGKRVAVIGTGASAIQFIPRIAKSVAHLTVFQRTPPWIIPKPDRQITKAEKWLFRTVPLLQRVYRGLIFIQQELLGVAFTHPRLTKGIELIARRHLRRQIPDPELRRKLRPDYRLGCKRMLVDNDYYPTLMLPNVDLVTEEIAGAKESSVLTRDGAEHPADVIIFGTGFHVTDPFDPTSVQIIGRNGLKISDAWKDGMQAYHGVAVAGFPNLFLLLGPNSGLGHNSVVYVIEAQIRYILQCLRLLRDRGARRIEVRREVQDAFNRDIQSKLAGTVWSVGGCKSWYLDSRGVNRALWPGLAASLWWRLRRPRPLDFELVG